MWKTFCRSVIPPKCASTILTPRARSLSPGPISPCRIPRLAKIVRPVKIVDHGIGTAGAAVAMVDAVVVMAVAPLVVTLLPSARGHPSRQPARRRAR